MYKLEIQMKYNRIITITADTYNEFQRKLDEFYLFNSDNLK